MLTKSDEQMNKQKIIYVNMNLNCMKYRRSHAFTLDLAYYMFEIDMIIYSR